MADFTIGVYDYWIRENNTVLINVNDTTLSSYPDIDEIVIYNETVYTVTNIQACFSGCTSLTIAPEIPDSVQNMDYCFDGCSSLMVAPEIPNSVTTMNYCFRNCTVLRGNIEVNNNPTNYSQIFDGTTAEQYDIFIIDNTANKSVSAIWRQIVSEVNKTRVHFEADDHIPSTVTINLERTDSEGVTTPFGLYLCVNIERLMHPESFPEGWAPHINEEHLFNGDLEELDITIGTNIRKGPYYIGKEGYTIIYELNDGYTSISVRSIIGKTQPLLDFYGDPLEKLYSEDKPGMGMAIGKTSERNGLDIEFPTLIGEGLEFSNTKEYFLTTDTSPVPTKHYYERHNYTQEIDLKDFYWDSRIGGGITWENDDGFITANGTCTGSSEYNYSSFKLVSSEDEVALDEGLYLIEGCFPDGSDSTYYCWTNYGNEYGEGLYFSQTNPNKTLSWFCRVAQGYTAEDLVFTPQLYKVYENSYYYEEVYAVSTDNPSERGWYEATTKVPLDYPQLIIGRYNDNVDNVRFGIGGGLNNEERRNLLTVQENKISTYDYLGLHYNTIPNNQQIIYLSEVPLPATNFIKIEGTYINSLDPEDPKQEFYMIVPDTGASVRDGTVTASYDKITNSILITIDGSPITYHQVQEDYDSIMLDYTPDLDSTMTIVIEDKDSGTTETVTTTVRSADIEEISLPHNWGTLVIDYNNKNIMIRADEEEEEYISFYLTVTYDCSLPSDLDLQLTYLYEKTIAYMYIGSHKYDEISLGMNSLLIGDNNVVLGDNSLGVGNNLRVTENNQLIVGENNAEVEPGDILVLANGSVLDPSNVMTVNSEGALKINSLGYPAYVTLTNSEGVQVGLHIGEGGANHGIWSDTLNKWLIYAYNSSGKDGAQLNMTSAKTARESIGAHNAANLTTGTLPGARLPLMLKTQAFTTSKFSQNGGAGSVNSITITVPSGYEFVGCIGANMAHNVAGSMGGFFKSTATQAKVASTNRSSSAWSDQTVTVYALFALSNIW